MLEDNPLLTVRDCLFSILAATLHIAGPFLHPQPEDAPCRGDREQLISWKYLYGVWIDEDVGNRIWIDEDVGNRIWIDEDVGNRIFHINMYDVIKCKDFSVHVRKAWKTGTVPTPIFNPGINWKRLISNTPWPFYTQKMLTSVPYA